MKKNVIKSFALSALCLLALQMSSCKKKEVPAPATVPTTETPAPAAAAPEPVEISADETLQTAAKDATKDFPGVNAMVSNGEITLTGEITRDRLPTLMQALNAIHPKKINNNLTIKK